MTNLTSIPHRFILFANRMEYALGESRHPLQRERESIGPKKEVLKYLEPANSQLAQC